MDSAELSALLEEKFGNRIAFAGKPEHLSFWFRYSEDRRRLSEKITLRRQGRSNIAWWEVGEETFLLGMDDSEGFEEEFNELSDLTNGLPLEIGARTYEHVGFGRLPKQHRYLTEDLGLSFSRLSYGIGRAEYHMLEDSKGIRPIVIAKFSIPIYNPENNIRMSVDAFNAETPEEVVLFLTRTRKANQMYELLNRTLFSGD